MFRSWWRQCRRRVEGEGWQVADEVVRYHDRPAVPSELSPEKAGCTSGVRIRPQLGVAADLRSAFGPRRNALPSGIPSLLMLC